MMGPAARVAVYYAPQPDDALSSLAAQWLGRDAQSSVTAPQPDLPGIAEITTEPRLYGFHATLKPPMRLAAGRQWPELLAAADRLAERTAPFTLPTLAVSDIFGFLALRETLPCAPLQALADDCVTLLDEFRAPPSEAELARRRRASLSPLQEAMLQRWGYPFVLETWFFHLTLTRRLTADEKAVYLPAAEDYFARAVATPRQVTDICLFVQPGAGEPFVIAERLPLRG